MTVHTIILIGVMLASGLFGGVINYLSGRKKNSTVLKSIVLGIGASFLVPLFLNMISSNLIEASKDDPSKVLVFTGFCLIAAISSSAFIGGISDRLLKEINDTKEQAAAAVDQAQQAQSQASDAANVANAVNDKIAPIMVKETEQEIPETLMVNSLGTVDLTEEEKKVLTALSNGKYTYRTVGGLLKDTDLDKTALADVMNKLQAEGLAGRIDSTDGTKWHITEEGKKNVILAQ